MRLFPREEYSIAAAEAIDRILPVLKSIANSLERIAQAMENQASSEEKDRILR